MQTLLLKQEVEVVFLSFKKQTNICCIYSFLVISQKSHSVSFQCETKAIPPNSALTARQEVGWRTSSSAIHEPH